MQRDRHFVNHQGYSMTNLLSPFKGNTCDTDIRQTDIRQTHRHQTPDRQTDRHMTDRQHTDRQMLIQSLLDSMFYKMCICSPSLINMQSGLDHNLQSIQEKQCT